MKTQTMLTAGILALLATSLAQADPVEDAKKIIMSPINQYERAQALTKWREEQDRLHREQAVADAKAEKEKAAKTQEQKRVQQERTQKEQERAQKDYQEESTRLKARDPVQTSPLGKRTGKVDPDSPAREAAVIQQGYVHLPDGNWVPPNDPRVKKLFLQGYVRLPDGNLVRPTNPR